MLLRPSLALTVSCFAVACTSTSSSTALEPELADAVVEPEAGPGADLGFEPEPEPRSKPNPEFLLDIGMDEVVASDDPASDSDGAGGTMESTEVVFATEPVEPERTPYEQAMEAGEAYTMLVMRGGPGLIGMDREELGELTVAHIHHLDAMAEDDFLLAAGATIAPRADAMLRNIGFCDSTDEDLVYTRGCGNPAAEAGVLEIEAVPFITSSNLRAVPGIERGLVNEENSERAAMQPYVIVEAPTSVAMNVVVERMQDQVVFAGDCVGGSFEGKTLMVLDCRTLAEANELMQSVESGEAEFRYHPWVAPVALAQIN